MGCLRREAAGPWLSYVAGAPVQYLVYLLPNAPRALRAAAGVASPGREPSPSAHATLDPPGLLDPTPALGLTGLSGSQILLPLARLVGLIAGEAGPFAPAAALGHLGDRALPLAHLKLVQPQCGDGILRGAVRVPLDLPPEELTRKVAQSARPRAGDLGLAVRREVRRVPHRGGGDRASGPSGRCAVRGL